MQKHVLVTGAAGFIGMHMVQCLLDKGIRVSGLDSLNDYYDVQLKKDRLAAIGIQATEFEYGKLYNHGSGPAFVRMNVEDREGLMKLFAAQKFTHVVHLAAQAGVRYSLQQPFAYADSNLTGFLSLLEACRHHPVQHLVFASTSSVYGLNSSMPFSVHDHADHPVSLYAATKKANEVMAHSYAHLYKIPSTGLRFFTVYGPYGRPDMAIYLFTKNICDNKPIQVFNHGKMMRDFTYVSDIVEAMHLLLGKPPQPNPDFDTANPDPATSSAPYRLYNIGNNQPVQLMDFIRAIEKASGCEAIIEYQDMQPGDVVATYADVSDLYEAIDFKPQTGIQQGIDKFVQWYRGYYGLPG